MDLTHALRRLARRPAFAVVAILTLALGIGANAAIYSVIRGVLLRPLPYAAPERMALIWNSWDNDAQTWLSEPEALDYREGVSSFAHFAVWDVRNANVSSGAGEPERVTVAGVSAGMFDVFGVAPAAGRYFTAEEMRRGAAPAVVLGHGLWQRRFGGDPR